VGARGYYYDDRGAIGGIRKSEGGTLVAAGDGENRGMIGRTSDGDLYVGRNGELYRRDQSGNWQQGGQGGWSNVNYDSLSPEQKQTVDSAKQSRQQASQTGASGSAERTQAGQTSREGLSRSSAGTRPSTGSISEGQVNRPSTTNPDVMSGLDRDASARSRGNQSYGSGGSRSRSAGSFSRGGGSRMGGRRR
jgi:hypothetical protein